MAEELRWVVTADDKDVIAAFRRMQKELEKTKQAQKQANDEGAKGGAKIKQGIESSVVSLSKAAIGWVSIQTAIRATTAEYQNYIDVQKQAADATIETANAQIVFMRNMGNMSAQQAMAIQDTVRQVAAANKTTESKIYQIATEAVSSKGSLTNEQMFANIGMAARLAPESTSEATAIAGALNATTRLTGSADPRVNAGLLLGIGEQARIPSMKSIADSLIPSAAAVKATLPETSTEEAAAFFSTLSLLSEDKTGERTGTASVQLAAQLRKFRKGTDLGDEIARLQNDPKARESFFKKMSLEAKPKAFVEQMLTGGTPAAELLKTNLANVPTGQTAIGVSDQWFRNVGQAPYQQAAAQQRAMQSLATQLDLQNFMGANAAINREGLQGILKASGAWMLEQTGSGMLFDLERFGGAAANIAAANQLEGRVMSLRGVTEAGTNARAADPASEMIAQKLDVMIAELRGQRADQKQPKKKNIDRNAEQ